MEVNQQNWNPKCRAHARLQAVPYTNTVTSIKSLLHVSEGMDIDIHVCV